MREGSATIAASNALRVLAHGRTLGFDFDHEPLLVVSDCDPDARIPARDMYALWALLARRLSLPSLPIQLAHGSRVEGLGLLGLCVATAPTFLEALQTFARYDGLLNQSRRVRVLVAGRTLEVRLESSHPRALGVRLSQETTLAQMLAAARQLCGVDVEPEYVAFRHSKPASLDAHRAHFRCPVRFDEPHDRLVFSRELAAATPPSANAAVWSYLCSQADAKLRGLLQPSVPERVRDTIDVRMAEGAAVASLSVAAVARCLGTSERTLRRELAHGGTSFRALVDETRRQRALTALTRGMPLSEAGSFAGFADASAFSHACRRWFGKPPSALGGHANGHASESPVVHTDVRSDRSSVRGTSP